MKLTPILTGVLAAASLAAAPLAGQTRVTVSVGVVAPPVYGHVVVGGPRYRVLPLPRVIYGTPRYHRYYSRPRVVVVVPRGHVHRRHHRHHYRSHW
jgi:hypothetical protein